MLAAPPDSSPGLTRAGLPPLYDQADNEADRWKRRFLQLVTSQIVLLYAGALTGAASRYAATTTMTVVSLVCFFIVAAMRLYQRFSPTGDRWPAARWVAERVKSLAWSYAVGAAPFTLDSAPQEARRHFGAAVLGVFEGWSWGGAKPPLEEQITPEMERLRSASGAERKVAYLRDRLEEQADWYNAKAKANQVAGHRWDLAFLIVSVAAIGGGVLQLAGLLQFDLLRLAGFAAALIVTWTGLNRHRRQSKTYRMTGHELRHIAREAPETADAPDWSAFVQRVETAIRREEAGWFEARN